MGPAVHGALLAAVGTAQVRCAVDDGGDVGGLQTLQVLCRVPAPNIEHTPSLGPIVKKVRRSLELPL